MLYTVRVKGIDLEIEDVADSTSLPYIVSELDLGSDYSLCHSISYKKGDIIVDLGANVGMFSIMMARLYPCLRIHAFEPLLVNYTHLVRNIERAGVADRVTPHNLAVTGDRRDVVIGSPPQCTGGAALHYGNYGTPDLIKNTVKSTTLTDIISRLVAPARCRLLKIDVEGSEYEILKKASPIIFNNIDMLVGEFHWIRDVGEDPQELKEFVDTVLGKDNVSVRLWGTKPEGTVEDWWKE